MEKPCILSFKVVEENGKRKGFGFVTAIIRLLEESANLKGLEDGHFRQEQDMFAILSCKHINDPLKIKAELFPYNLQKLLPIVLFLPLVIEQDNAWKIAILFCDVALDTIVLQFLLEILSVRKASVGIVVGERATNENVLDIKTWAILFEDHCFMVKEMLYLTKMHQHFLDDAYLSDALPLNPRNSLIAQTSYFKKVISIVANSLTSSMNLEIEVKLLFQEDGTIAASILLFLFHGMHFKERGKSGTKEALQFVAETEQQCGTMNAMMQYLWLFEEFPLKVMHAYVDSFNFRGNCHAVLIIQRRHFASYLEREWQCSTYYIQATNVSIGAYDATGTMTTNHMAVAKLVALRLRPIILLQFRVEGITYNQLDGEILNWPTG